MTKSRHEIFRGIPLTPSPIVVGYNEVRAKNRADVLLNLRESESGRVNPLLVVGTFGSGRTAAWTTDVAPHWCGGLVDWGKKRVKIRVRNGIEIEVGDLYVKFFSQLMKWLAKKSD